MLYKTAQRVASDLGQQFFRIPLLGECVLSSIVAKALMQMPPPRRNSAARRVIMASHAAPSCRHLLHQSSVQSLVSAVCSPPTAHRSKLELVPSPISFHGAQRDLQCNAVIPPNVQINRRPDPDCPQPDMRVTSRHSPDHEASGACPALPFRGGEL